LFQGSLYFSSTFLQRTDPPPPPVDLPPNINGAFFVARILFPPRSLLVPAQIGGIIFSSSPERSGAPFFLIFMACFPPPPSRGERSEINCSCHISTVGIRSLSTFSLASNNSFQANLAIFRERGEGLFFRRFFLESSHPFFIDFAGRSP